MITGTYDNGAKRVDYHFVMYDDCPVCNGRGYMITSRWGWSNTHSQCPECERRFESKEYIRERVKAIEAQTASMLHTLVREDGISVAKSKPLTPQAWAWLEDFAFSDLAREYRALLVKYWTYQEPALTPA